MAVTFVPANIVKDMAGAFWPWAAWCTRPPVRLRGARWQSALLWSLTPSSSSPPPLRAACPVKGKDWDLKTFDGEAERRGE